jgi:hypothetical protein
MIRFDLSNSAAPLTLGVEGITTPDGIEHLIETQQVRVLARLAPGSDRNDVLVGGWGGCGFLPSADDAISGHEALLLVAGP